MTQRIVGFAFLFGLFAVIEGLWPEQQQPRLRRGGLTDTVWFFASALVRPVGTVLAVIAIALLAGWLPHPVIPSVGGQPAALQLVEALLISDFCGYWVHRAFHGRRLWRVHAVHHSIEQLDWLSAARVHPVDTIVHRVSQIVPLFMLGFSSVRVLPAITAVLGVYPILLHANVRWTYGPVRYVVAGPQFHRWHHTAEQQGFNKNFAGLFPFIDGAFGTLHLPARHSTSYGLGSGHSMPTNFIKQLWYPFARRRAGYSPRG